MEELFNSKTIRIGYFEYLYELVDEDNYSNYKCLLSQMLDTIYIPIIDRDESRVSEGFNLRENYISEFGYDEFNYQIHSSQISVLEVLIGLATKCDEQVMGDISKGNRRADWFWRMVKNLDLMPFTDDVYCKDIEQLVDEKLRIFVYRAYEYNGNGGIFPLKNPPGDERKVELWYQMMAYLNENFPI